MLKMQSLWRELNKASKQQGKSYRGEISDYCYPQMETPEGTRREKAKRKCEKMLGFSCTIKYTQLSMLFSSKFATAIFIQNALGCRYKEFETVMIILNLWRSKMSKESNRIQIPGITDYENISSKTWWASNQKIESFVTHSLLLRPLE